MNDWAILALMIIGVLTRIAAGIKPEAHSWWLHVTFVSIIAAFFCTSFRLIHMLMVYKRFGVSRLWPHAAVSCTVVF